MRPTVGDPDDLATVATPWGHPLGRVEVLGSVPCVVVLHAGHPGMFISYLEIYNNDGPAFSADSGWDWRGAGVNNGLDRSIIHTFLDLHPCGPFASGS